MLLEDLKARAMLVRRPHIRFGPVTLELEVPTSCGYLFGRRWLEDKGAASLRFACRVSLDEPQPSVVFSRFDANGYCARAPWATVELDRTTGQGAITFHAPAELPEGQYTATAAIEGVLAAGLAEVLVRGGLALHAMTLQVGGRAWVVAGHSGAGKTTLARRFPGVASHDEVAYLVPTPDGWTAWHHAEWRGLPGDHASVLPLGGLFVLLPDERSCTQVVRAPAGERAALVLARAYHAGGAATAWLLDAAAALGRDVPVGLLSHSLDDPPAAVVQALASYSELQECA